MNESYFSKGIRMPNWGQWGEAFFLGNDFQCIFLQGHILRFFSCLLELVFMMTSESEKEGQPIKKI